MRQFEYSDLLGSPFVDGGRDPAYGLDCWGLVRVCFARCGVELPDYPIGCLESAAINDEIERNRPQWVPVEAGKLEDEPSLVAMRLAQTVMINHVGVYVGGGKFLHTEQRKGVHMDRADAHWWRRHIEGFYVPGW